MKAMDEKTFRELCLAHALGALDADREAALSGALETADEGRMLIYADAIEAASHAAPPVPAPSVKDGLMARIAAARNGTVRGAPGAVASPRDLRPAPPKRRPALAYAALAFGLIMAALAGLQWRRADAAEARLSAVRDTLAADKAMLAMLQAPGLRMAALMPPSRAPAAAGTSAKILWDAEGRKGMLRVSDLPPAPEDKEYFLWILVDDKADPCVNAGAFAVQAASGGGFYHFQGNADLARLHILGFEITLEDKGASHHHDEPHLHPEGKTLLRSVTFL